MPSTARPGHPAWGTVLRALRVLGGVTQDGFAARLGVGTRTVQRWERGGAAPDGAAEAALQAYCRAKGLYRRYDAGVLAGQDVSPEWLSALLARARLEGAAPAGGDPSAPPRGRGLPAPSTALIGREAEVAEAVESLRRGRLVTLTGPGGVGKTRVALAAAAALVDAFGEGAVCFVALGSLVDRHLVLPTIGRALGLRAGGGESPLAALQAALSGRPALLVLDNLEQLLDAAPDVAELQATCPRLHVLATSRAPLRVAGERELPIPPLPTPDPAATLALEALSAVPAVRLFCERGRDVSPDFALTAANAATVAAICRRVDGLPLALELAAARLKLLSPEALLARLDDRLGVLTAGRRDAPARQRTLRDTIAWSHELLAPDEQELFRRLAVFVGGFTLAAAERVCGRGAGTEPDDGGRRTVLDGLASLADQSLLRREAGLGAEPRLAMLETVREFAAERLSASGERDLVRRRHADVFLELAEQVSRRVAGAARRRWHDRLEAEHDNLRAAFGWCVAAGDVEGELRLGAALFWFWAFRGHWAEGRARLEAPLARPGCPDDALRTAALWQIGAFCWYQGDLAAGHTALEESLAGAQAAGDRESLAHASEFLGLVELYEGNRAAARTHFERCLALFRRMGNRWGQADALHLLGDAAAEREQAEALLGESLALYRALDDPLAALPLTSLGYLALTRGDHAAARALLTEGLAVRRADADRWLLAISLASLAEVARCEDHLAEARRLLEEGLTLSRAVGSKSTTAWVLCSLGQVVLRQGDARGAAALLAEALPLARDLGHKQRIAACVVGLAGVLAAEGQPQRAAELLYRADALCAASGAALEPADQRDRDRHLRGLRRRLSAAAIETAWAAGREARADRVDELGDWLDGIGGRSAGAPRPHGLTPREAEVAALLARGLTNRQIADELVIAPGTAGLHVKHVLAKLGVRSRAQAAAWAARAGLSPG